MKDITKIVEGKKIIVMKNEEKEMLIKLREFLQSQDF